MTLELIATVHPGSVPGAYLVKPDFFPDHAVAMRAECYVDAVSLARNAVEYGGAETVEIMLKRDTPSTTGPMPVATAYAVSERGVLVVLASVPTATRDKLLKKARARPRTSRGRRVNAPMNAPRYPSAEMVEAMRDGDVKPDPATRARLEAAYAEQQDTKARKDPANAKLAGQLDENDGTGFDLARLVSVVENFNFNPNPKRCMEYHATVGWLKSWGVMDDAGMLLRRGDAAA